MTKQLNGDVATSDEDSKTQSSQINSFQRDQTAIYIETNKFKNAGERLYENGQRN